MFFDDDDLALKKHSRLRVPPPVPETGWRPPQYFPNLSAASVISFDVETRELDFDRGPGWSRGKSHIVGFSVAARQDRTGETGKWYFPIRHVVEPEYNLDAHNCLAWLNSQLNTPHLPKVGANLLYDIGSLSAEGVNVAGKLYDVQFAESLLDDEGDVNLDWLGRKYLKQSKTSDDLYQWCALAYGGNATGVQRGNIWRAPPRLVGPYGEDDADLPLRILEKQHPLLYRDGLLEVFYMECGLIPLLLRMRWQGVRVDIPRAEQLYHDLGKTIPTLEAELASKVGLSSLNVNSPGDLAKAYDYMGIKYPRTPPSTNHPNGQPSFQKEWLAAQKDPLSASVNNIREHIKIRSTFLRSYILEGHINGVIHCQFHNMRSDEGGTKTGRFASSTPNLQNIPVRTKLGKAIRECFVPFQNHLRWRKIDYSQIEYRMLAHFAVDGANFEFERVKAFWAGQLAVWGFEGQADLLRRTYVEDPKTDYHDFVQANVKLLTGIEIERKPIKNINFGLLYGQTEKALAYKAGFTTDQSKQVFTAYHQGAPYAKPTMKAIEMEVHRKGFVQTVMGRRTRFDLWEPSTWGERGQALHYRHALAEYGQQIRRAYAYRGVNYKLQGSAADVIKKAMRAAYDSGVFDVIGFPLLQVHDELDFSEIDDSPAQREAYAFLQHTLETTMPLRIPVKAEVTLGQTWAEAA